ncbi:MAG: hypothetical protein EBV34_11310 [Betaproteobacteria bacterium]|jgi:hypothetical protein|nr:hypothetical protein [Betaproteobacteria bacterium]NDE53412.1 hypothetical protein [Actinomycetota bacterium]
MILIFSLSGDGTADLLSSRFAPTCFRINYDIWHDYSIEQTPHYWRLEDPTGRYIDSKNVSRAFWWKTFNVDLPLVDPMITAEIRYTFREIYAHTKRKGIVRGNPPDWHKNWGKTAILNVASRYLKTPLSLVSWQGLGISKLPTDKSYVAKSLDTELTAEGKALFTTKVELSKLDLSYPWFIQEFIESDWDVTIQIIGSKLFPFRRSRKDLKGIDWRSEQSFRTDIEEWEPLTLSASDERAVRSVFSDLSVDFGRMDLMIEKSTGDMIFLEYNANGQWVFLDFNEKYGILDAVVEYIKG